MWYDKNSFTFVKEAKRGFICLLEKMTTVTQGTHLDY